MFKNIAIAALAIATLANFAEISKLKKAVAEQKSSQAELEAKVAKEVRDRLDVQVGSCVVGDVNQGMTLEDALQVCRAKMTVDEHGLKHFVSTATVQ
jgi:hypothetical protein